MLGAYTQNICLYNNVSISGQKIIPLKLDTVTNENQIFNFTQSDIYLNDKLNIEILGMKNSKVKLKIRYT